MVLTLAAAIIGPAALAQSADQLLNYQALLNAELARYKRLGMASVDDIRCISAAARLTRLPYQ